MPSLKADIACDVVVIGGGMAGLHAAQRLQAEGKSVVLLERGICGGSATGKSAGCLTPYSDLELHQLARRYGDEQARLLWQAAAEGINLIVSNINTYGFACDLKSEDSLYLAQGKRGVPAVEEEVRAFERFGIEHHYYDSAHLREIISDVRGYKAAVRYGGTYSMNPFKYARQLKNLLVEKGVRVFENTEAIGIAEDVVRTSAGSVKANTILVCIDNVKHSLSSVAKDLYAIQSFVAVSEPLSDAQLKKVFPGETYLGWDTGLAFTYFRVTSDKRIILGGGTSLSTFSTKDTKGNRVIRSVIRSFKRDFPLLKNLVFTHYWSGHITAARDFAPIIATERSNSRVQYVLGCIGLGWAAFCGIYAVKRMLGAPEHVYERHFRIGRSYFIPRWVQKIIGKKISFFLSAFYHKFIESATLRG